MQDTDLPWLEVSATQLKVLSVDLLKASVKTRVWSLSLGKLGLVDIQPSVIVRGTQKYMQS